MFDKNLLTTSKNLLAFSAGIDSTALFFLLLESNINFDIAIVDYGIRKQSKDEIKYANKLAKKYNKICHTITYDKNKKFSEKDARDFRYNFFEQLISIYNYNLLLTAHQLNDNLEWFFMQLSKGAGLEELIGLQKINQKKNYILYRPLLEISKQELLEFLNKNNIKYFIDETNIDIKYKRNYFRKEFSDKFINEYRDGVKRSLNYLQNDIDSLNSLGKYFEFDKIYIGKFKTDDINIIIRFIDKSIKKLGVVISKSTRDEIIKQKQIIISNKIAVTIINNIIWITPYKNITMYKKFKERCRVLKIPKNTRGFLSKYDKNRFDDFIKEFDDFIKEFDDFNRMV